LRKSFPEGYAVIPLRIGHGDIPSWFGKEVRRLRALDRVQRTSHSHGLKTKTRGVQRGFWEKGKGVGVSPKSPIPTLGFCTSMASQMASNRQSFSL
ncbi:hypothetical protein U1Q18_021291, partial [Sarracenia purpurea var. burkii]